MVSDENRVLAVFAGLLILAGPRRTRPLAGFLYGVFLSRVAGAGRNRIMAELLRLFDERQSVGRRVDELEEAVGEALDEARAAHQFVLRGGEPWTP